MHKLLAFNDARPARGGGDLAQRPGLGMRVFARPALRTHPARQLPRGQSPWRYLRPRAFTLPLGHLADVRAALDASVPPLSLPHLGARRHAHPTEVRIAFDSDAVLFSDEAERIYQCRASRPSVTNRARPARRWRAFKPLLEALPPAGEAPSAHPHRAGDRAQRPHERAIRADELEHRVDGAMFLGSCQGRFLREFEPDFFDDQTGHINPPRSACRRATWPRAFEP